MLIRLKRWLEPPFFEGDEEKSHQAQIANTLILYLGAALLLFILVFIPIFAFQKIGSWILSGSVFAGLVVGRHLMFKGHFQLGLTLILAIIYVCVLAMLILSGGASSTAMFYLATVVLIAGYFLKPQLVNWLTIPTFLIAMGVSILQDLGLVTIPKLFVFNSVFSWIATGLGLLLMIHTRDLFVGKLNHTVTSVQKNNLALQESEKKYRELFEINQDGIAIFTVNPLRGPGTFIEVNRAAHEMLGYTREEMLRLTPTVLEPQITREQLAWRRAEFEAQRAATFETTLRHKNGQPVFAEITTQPMRYENHHAVMSILRDITERKRAEEALRESEARFSSIFHASPVRVALTHAESGRFLDVNEAFLNSTGYSREEVIGYTSLDLNDWVNPDELVKFRSQVQEQGSVRNFETRLRHKQGQIREVLIFAELVELSSESCILCVSMDITERKQAEEALRLRESYLTAILENQPGLVWLKDRNGRFLTVNQSFAQACGKTSAAELVGKTDLDIWPRELAEKYRADDAQILQSKASRMLEEPIVIQQQTTWFETFKTPILNDQGEVLGTTGYSHDITERKHAEEKLRESEARLRAIIEDAPIAIALSRNGGLIYVNPVYVRMHGFSNAEELIGQPTLERVAPRNRQAKLERVQRRAHHLFFEEIYELNNLRRDGTEFPVLISVSQVKLADGLANLVFLQDITDRKQAEEQIKKSLAEKETLLRELYHRTKNNMNVIIALLEMQSDYFEDERLQAAFAEAGNRIRSMALVHQKLYETSDLSQINLKDYINNLAALLEKSYSLSNGKVSFVFELEEVLVLIDTAIPCGLILNELISNALKYAFPAGRSGQITIQLRRIENGEIQFCVSDNGIGLPEGFDPRRDGNLGLNNLFLLGETQLKAQVSLLSTTSGVTCRLQFRDNLYQPRV